MEGSGSATKNNVVHPKHTEEEETSPNKNHIITGKDMPRLHDGQIHKLSNVEYS